MDEQIERMGSVLSQLLFSAFLKILEEVLEGVLSSLAWMPIGNANVDLPVWGQ
jgi:hypothetical protein